MENGDIHVRNRKHALKTSPRILHSSPAEEKLRFPFSENGPSAIQGEGATSPFSDLREWEERGVTTPNEYRARQLELLTLDSIFSVLYSMESLACSTRMIHCRSWE
jgi:hypothetical protein